MPQCLDCKVELVVGENWTQSSAKQYVYRCKACVYKKSRAWAVAHAETTKEYMHDWHAEKKPQRAKQARGNQLKRLYGITQEQYDFWNNQQNGRCAVCKLIPKKPLYVDHDHQSGVVRGLLCNNCNTALGMMNDNVENILQLAVYLQRANSN